MHPPFGSAIHRFSRLAVIVCIACVLSIIASFLVFLPGRFTTIPQAHASGTLFSTGLESGDPQPTWTNTIDSGPGDAGSDVNVASPQVEAVTNQTAHAGTGSLLYSGTDNSTSVSHAYLKVFDLSSQNIALAWNTVLSYWIYPQSSATNSNVSGDNSTCVAIDMIFGDGNDLRDAGAVDQNGNALHPAGQCGHLTLDTWNHVVSNIGKYRNSEVINRIDVAYDQGPNTGGYGGYIDDISISDPAPNPGNPQEISTTYPTDDRVIADYVATSSPYNADPTGSADSTNAIQQALFDCSDSGGGTVWLPDGQYKITGSIIIPPHTTLRGDWRDPDTGSGSYGTVILADVSSGSSTDPGLFRISGSAGVDGLTVYYPNQSASTPVAYPYTFEVLGQTLGPDGYMDGTVQHVTLLDSYRGIIVGNAGSSSGVNEQHNVREVKGTTLSVGLYLENSADVGTVENVTLNDSYWANLDSSISGTAPSLASIQSLTRTSATGMQIGDLDWDHFLNLSFSDEEIGVDVVAYQRQGMTAHLFGITVQNSNIAFRISGNYLYGGLGLNIANSTLQANQGSDPIAVQITDTSHVQLHFNDDTIGGGATTAVQLNGTTDVVEFMHCTFDSWTGAAAVTANSGSLEVDGSTFTPTLSSSNTGVSLQSGLTSAALLGNLYTGSPLYTNTASSATVEWMDSGFTFPSDGLTSSSPAPIYKPSSSNFIKAAASPYGAVGNGSTDNTTAIQDALTAAGNAGGGTVYVPAGIYVISGDLSVPAGVELRGADSVPARTDVLNGGEATGTIFYAYADAGTSTPTTDTAFITLNGNSAGIRGINIHYPDQENTTTSLVTYPYAIRGNGSDVYVYDVSFSDAYLGIDFATDSTNGHVISHVTGFTAVNGIKVGNSNEGWVENVLLNITAWARTGGLPNSVIEGSGATMWTVAAAFSHANETAYWATSGAQNEHWTNDFTYGAHTGFLVDSNANVIGLNLASDGDLYTADVVNTGSNGAEFVNLAGCGCVSGNIGLQIGGGSVSLFGFIYVASVGGQGLQVTGGSYLLQGPNFSGGTASITGGSGVLEGGWFRSTTATDVTVSGSSTIANLWGNVGTNGFTYSFINGAPSLIWGNIPSV